jgi:hypothetical protein
MELIEIFRILFQDCYSGIFQYIALSLYCRIWNNYHYGKKAPPTKKKPNHCIDQISCNLTQRQLKKVNAHSPGLSSDVTSPNNRLHNHHTQQKHNKKDQNVNKNKNKTPTVCKRRHDLTQQYHETQFQSKIKDHHYRTHTPPQPNWSYAMIWTILKIHENSEYIQEILEYSQPFQQIKKHVLSIHQQVST